MCDQVLRIDFFYYYYSFQLVLTKVLVFSETYIFYLLILRNSGRKKIIYFFLFVYLYIYFVQFWDGHSWCVAGYMFS